MSSRSRLHVIWVPPVDLWDRRMWPSYAPNNWEILKRGFVISIESTHSIVINSNCNLQIIVTKEIEELWLWYTVMTAGGTSWHKQWLKGSFSITAVIEVFPLLLGRWDDGEDMELPVVVPAQALEGGEVVSEPLQVVVFHPWGKPLAQDLWPA